MKTCSLTIGNEQGTCFIQSNENYLIPYSTSGCLGLFGEEEVNSNYKFKTNPSKDNEIKITFKTTNDKLERLSQWGWEIYQYTQNMPLREELYLQALKNLLKKNDFYELSLQMHEGLLTEAELEKELKKNSSKYFIEFKEMKNPNYLTQIVEIIKKIEKKFTIDQIAEMFSVKQTSLEKNVSLLLGKE